MCLIVAKGSGIALPLKKHLKEGCSSNKDGTGVCYWKKGDNKVHIKKDFLNFEHFHFWLTQNITPEDSLIVHFRKATSGLVDNGNRHPFPVTSNPDIIRQDNLTTKLAVAHNGVFFKFNSKGDADRNEIHSDTQNFIMEILSNKVVKNNLDNPVLDVLLNEFIGTNKLSFMDKEGSIRLCGLYQEEKTEGGILYYSNSSYKVFESYSGYSGYSGYGNSHSNNYGRGNYFDELEENENRRYNTDWFKNHDKKKVYPSHIELKKLPNKTGKGFSGRGGENLFGKCDCCDFYGSISLLPGVGANHEENYNVCKKCRKKVAKGKLVLEEAFCSHCEKPEFVSRLINKFNEFPLCRDCIKQYADVI